MSSGWIQIVVSQMTVNGAERAVICWEVDPDEGADAPEPSDSTQNVGAGRPAKYTLADFGSAFPRGEENRKPYGQVYHRACDCLYVPKGTFNGLLKRWLESGEIRRHDDGKYYV